MSAAPNVTDSEPAIMGIIPYSPRPGAHVAPNTEPSMGIPSRKMNSVITANAVIEVSANTKNIRPDSFSLNLDIIPNRSFLNRPYRGFVPPLA
jgi:hypothetical protein